jgi:predicted acylesterase/phospholipase RssA
MRRLDVPYIPPKRLIFSGGGIRVISYVGVIQVLQERNFLNKIREFCGVSAGALVSLMLSLGYTNQIIERFCFEYDFSKVNSIDPENILQIFDNFGIDNGENLQKLINKILYHKGFSPNATFEDLHRSGRVKNIRVWAADLQYLKPIEFSYCATPKIQVVTAICASMSLPLYFIPVKHPETHTLMSDGGVFDNYPISYLSDEEAEESLGVCFEFENLPVEISDISTFITMLSNGYYIPSYRKLIQKYLSRSIIIPCAEQSSIDFEIKFEDRLLLVSKGRKAAENFFLNPPDPKLLRRHSIS